MRTRNVTRRQSDLMVDLQLTHSGRFARPNRKDLLEPRIAYHHPILDRKFGIAPDDDRVVLTDGEVEALTGDFVGQPRSPRMWASISSTSNTAMATFSTSFSAPMHARDGTGAILKAGPGCSKRPSQPSSRACPSLLIGVRLSAFDLVPFRPDPAESSSGRLGPGIPEEFADLLPYTIRFRGKRRRPDEIRSE